MHREGFRILEARHCFSPRLARRSLAVLAATTLLIASCGESRPEEFLTLGPDTPVVVIVIDTLRADHLSCYGYPLQTSPVLDEFASRSFLFEANSTQCNATVPSITSIFTGVYPKTHRNYLAVPTKGTGGQSGQVRSAAERFGEQGYFTTATTSHPSWGADTDRDAALWRGWDSISHLGSPVPIEDRPLFARAENTNERLFELLDDYDRNHSTRPLFLWAHYFDPHTDYFGNLYDPPLELRNRFLDHHLEQFGLGDFAEILGPLDPETRNQWILSSAQKPLRDELKLACGRAGYDAEIVSCDRGIQQLFDRLDRSGLLDKAVIVVMSDHGENMEEHTDSRDAHPFTHGRLYDGVSHTPLLIHLPGQLEGRRISAITQNIDVLPTLLELLDLPGGEGLDGKSLVPLMSGLTTQLHDVVYIESSVGSEKAVRSEDLKLTDGWKPEEREVYAWRSDPGELYNLSESIDEEVPEDLLGALEEFRPEVQLRIRCIPMKTPYKLEIQAHMPGVRLKSVEGVARGTISEDRETFTWSGSVGSEGLEIVLHPQVYTNTEEVHWRIRHTGREDLHKAVRLGRTPVSSTPAIPLWYVDQSSVPNEPAYVITEDAEAGTSMISVEHEGARQIECEVRYVEPRHDKIFEVVRAEGFAERFPPSPQHHRADAIHVDRALLELLASHPEAARYYLLRVDGAWPAADRLMINGKGVDTKSLHFMFPALPKDRRIQPYLSARPSLDMQVSPGSILIWQESGGGGGEIDAGNLSPELAKQLGSIGYLGDSSGEDQGSDTEQ